MMVVQGSLVCPHRSSCPAPCRLCSGKGYTGAGTWRLDLPLSGWTFLAISVGLIALGLRGYSYASLFFVYDYAPMRSLIFGTFSCFQIFMQERGKGSTLHGRFGLENFQ